MSMFCYQCEQSAAPGGCTVQGVCGKTAPVANLQDELTAALVGLARALDVKGHTKEGIDYIMRGLFMCVTNVNFSDQKVRCAPTAAIDGSDVLIGNYPDTVTDADALVLRPYEARAFIWE